MHSHISDDIHWRSGVLLKDSTTETIALVETDTESKRIELKITGLQKREYLFILRFVLADIHNSFSHLNVKEKIGLSDDISVDYNYLVTRAEKGDKIYSPQEDPTKEYDINELLGIVTAAPSEVEIMQMIELFKTQGIKEEKDWVDHFNNIFELKPGLFGLSINLNTLLRKAISKSK